MVSSMGAGDPVVGERADAPVPAGQARRRRGARGLEPRLDDRAPGPPDRRARIAGTVDLAERLGRYGEVPREDVASVLLAMLEAENTVRGTYELLGGDVPVDEAVAALVT